MNLEICFRDGSYLYIKNAVNYSLTDSGLLKVEKDGHYLMGRL